MSDWKHEQALAEMEAGRRLTMKNMAMGLIEQLQADYKVVGDVKLDHTDRDVRNWTVTVDFKNGVVHHTENFWEFPSDTLRAMLMLLNK